MNSTFDPSFLRAIILMTGWRGTEVDRFQAGLLMLGLRGQDFSAADLPAELSNGNVHIAGCATGRLLTLGLIEVVGRVKSPNKNAHGRKLNLLRIPSQKVSAARTWLRDRGYLNESEQLSLAV